MLRRVYFRGSVRQQSESALSVASFNPEHKGVAVECSISVRHPRRRIPHIPTQECGRAFAMFHHSADSLRTLESVDLPFKL